MFAPLLLSIQRKLALNNPAALGAMVALNIIAGSITLDRHTQHFAVRGHQLGYNLNEMFYERKLFTTNISFNAANELITAVFTVGLSDYNRALALIMTDAVLSGHSVDELTQAALIHPVVPGTLEYQRTLDELLTAPAQTLEALLPVLHAFASHH